MVKLREELLILAKLEDHITAEYKRLGVEGDRFARKTDAAMRKAEQSSGRLSTALGGVAGKLAGLGAGFASFGAVAAASRDAIEFSKAMAEVSTIVDTSVVDMALLEEGVLGIAAAHGQLGSDVARGLYQTISSGAVDAKDSVELLASAQNLATAGLASTEQAVDLITTALNAYGLSVDEAGRVSDQLFKTVELGKTTIPELASSLGQVLSIASALGVPLDEVLGLVASITTKGVATAEAVTQVRAAMVGLLKKTGEVNEVFSRLGFEFNDATIRTLGLRNTLELLREATNNSEAELTQLLGRVEGTNATLNTTGKNAESAARSIAKIGDSAGSVEKALEKVAGAAGVKFQRELGKLRQNLQTGFGAPASFFGTKALAAINSIGDALGGVVGGSADYVGESFAKWVVELDSAATYIERVADASGRVQEIRPPGLDFTPDPEVSALENAPQVGIGLANREGDLRVFENTSARIQSMIRESDEAFLAAFDLSPAEQRLRSFERAALDSYDRQLAALQRLSEEAEKAILLEREDVGAEETNRRLQALYELRDARIAEIRAAAQEAPALQRLNDALVDDDERRLRAIRDLLEAREEEIRTMERRGLIGAEQAQREMENARAISEALRAQLAEQQRLNEERERRTGRGGGPSTSGGSFDPTASFEDYVRDGANVEVRATNLAINALQGFEGAVSDSAYQMLRMKGNLRDFGQALEEVARQILAQAIGQGIATGIFQLFPTGAATGGYIPGFSGGGHVRDPRDTVLAALRPNEFVLRPEAARSIGRFELERMNRTGKTSTGGSGETSISVSMPLTVVGQVGESPREFASRVEAVVVRGLHGASSQLVQAARHAAGGRT